MEEVVLPQEKVPLAALLAGDGDAVVCSVVRQRARRGGAGSAGFDLGRQGGVLVAVIFFPFRGSGCLGSLWLFFGN